MTVKYPIWINKIEGAAQTPEEMNGIVEVLQNHAETLSLHDIRILAASSGIYTDALTPTSEVPAEVGDKVFLVTQPGTYTNFGNVVLPENNFGFIFKNGSSFSLQSVKLPVQDLTPLNNRITQVEEDVNGIGYVNNILEDYIPNEEVKIVDYITGTINNSGGINESLSNKRAILNVENLIGNTINYNGYNFGILSNLLNTYSTIIAEKTDGSFEVVYPSVLVENVSMINYNFTVKNTYKNIHFNIRNDSYSLNIPVIKSITKYKDKLVISDVRNTNDITESSVFFKKFSGKYFHFSFDDIWISLKLLTQNASNYNSLWEDKFFKVLKNFHDNYGVKFSLYCFQESTLVTPTWDIANMTEKFKSDFQSASDWLKFGFHAKDSSSAYNSATIEEITTDYNYVMSNILRFTDSYDCIDRIPRLHGFAGNLNNCKALRDNSIGCLGFLTADDVRNSYYLDSNQNSYMNTHDKFYDSSNFLHFFKTETRLDSIEDVELWYDDYIKNVNLSREFVAFCHENRLYAHSGGGTILTAFEAKLDILFQKAKASNYFFDYPQNRL
ncbi:hypothetical protein OBJ93_06915 [Empedobacter falsenii]